MGSAAWMDVFIQTLYEKYPQKLELAQELINLLRIERESVYRRLRQDVSFTIPEIVKISSAWNISLDKITGVQSGEIPFFMKPINYLDPSEEEVKFLRIIIQSLDLYKDFPDTEFRDICNKLPRQLLAGYGYLNKFYLFRCAYKYNGEKKVVPFSQIVLSEEKIRLTVDYYRAIKNVPQSNFLFDHMLFQYLINDIRYFHSVRMITDEDKEHIKKDLHDLLDYLSEVATHGCYPETQNEVNIYISHLNVDTNYSYVLTHLANICFVHVFDKHEIYTYSPEMVANFKTWTQLKKRTSIQISGVDEKSRMEYFGRQRALVDGL
jgi:hypothetical protein